MAANGALIKVGLCAMDKKVDGKPMQALCKLMSQACEFVRFGDHLLLHQPIDEWPECDCLIAFYSDGFPLGKAMEYTAKYPHMFCLNNLDVQNHLFDRRWVYKMCTDNNIPTPRHVFCNRGEDERGQLIDGMVPKPNFPPAWTSSTLEEFEDYIIVDGERFDKPFVEKPASGEDHNVWIYYPRAAGGGIKKLFRKVGDKSSNFSPDENNVRRDGSYIYEQFMPTEGTDVKVYAVGQEYAHAEARKSPVVDGVVARSSDGKEVRYPIILSRKQKRIAHQVVQAFKQTVCGFDLLVCGNKSYVCDVNGWSFVKSSKRFWDDAAKQLTCLMREHLRSLAKLSGPRMHPRTASVGDIGARLASASEEEEGGEFGSQIGGKSKPEESDGGSAEKMEHLRCVIAIIRHADRTPKQKMKLKIRKGGPCQELLDLMERVGNLSKVKGEAAAEASGSSQPAPVHAHLDATACEPAKTGSHATVPAGHRDPLPQDETASASLADRKHDSAQHCPKTKMEETRQGAHEEGKAGEESRGEEHTASATGLKEGGGKEGGAKEGGGDKKDKKKESKDKDKKEDKADPEKGKVKVKEVKLKTALHLTQCLEATRTSLERIAQQDRFPSGVESEVDEEGSPTPTPKKTQAGSTPKSLEDGRAADDIDDAKPAKEESKALKPLDNNVEAKLLQMKAVLEKGGHFDGINRKVQIKPLKWVVDDGVPVITQAQVV